MASSGPESFAKRQRERAKQMERARKFAQKLERNARKRAEKAARDSGQAPPLDQTAPEDRDESDPDRDGGQAPESESKR